MSITDELREWAKTLTHWWYDPMKDEYTYTTGATPPSIDAIRLDSNIIAIADRIDAEHERMLGDWDYWESTHVELPKDADGEYIHVGDEMCGYVWPNGGIYCRAIVNEVTILVGPQDGAYRGWLMWDANECRHHHDPTVEDVLREFADLVRKERVELATIGEDAIAEYASKLRLAEGEDA